MILRSKIIDTQLQNNLHSTPFMERSVNYFRNFGVECHLLKIGYTEFSFIKHRGCQYNLPIYFIFKSQYHVTLEFASKENSFENLKLFIRKINTLNDLKKLIFYFYFFK